MSWLCYRIRTYPDGTRIDEARSREPRDAAELLLRGAAEEELLPLALVLPAHADVVSQRYSTRTRDPIAVELV